MQLRNRAYKRVMSAGLTQKGRMLLAIKLWWGELVLWHTLCLLAIMEKIHKWRMH